MSDTQLKYPEWPAPLQELSKTPMSELQAYPLALDQKSDMLSHLPMAAYVVQADGVVIWYNSQPLNFGAANRPSVRRTNVFAVPTPFTTRTAHLWHTAILL